MLENFTYSQYIVNAQVYVISVSVKKKVKFTSQQYFQIESKPF